LSASNKSRDDDDDDDDDIVYGAVMTQIISRELSNSLAVHLLNIAKRLPTFRPSQMP